jgi:hypothetical protein
MLCLYPMPLNRRLNVPNLPDTLRVCPPAQRVRSSAGSSQVAYRLTAQSGAECFPRAEILVA